MDEFERIDIDAEEAPEDEDQERAEDAADGQDGQEQPEEGAGRSGSQEEQPGRRQRAPDAAVRAARVQAGREAEGRLRREFDEQIAAAGVINPYTGAPFRSIKEFEEYGRRYRAEQRGQQAEAQGRSVHEVEEDEENRAYLSKLRKQAEAQESQRQADARKRRQLLADALDFQDQYPGVDISALEKDARFRRFAGSRLYNEPLADLYEAYLSVVGEAQSVGEAKAAGKKRRGTGGGSGGEGVTLSPAQQRELDEWNRAYPEMKMSAKEFAGR